MRHRQKPIGPQYIVDSYGCWLWQWSTKPKGYGWLRENGKVKGAHRVMYERLYGPVPDTYDLHHMCGIRNCVNPSHLLKILHEEHGKMHGGQACGVVRLH